jgi:hypothetical protein
MVRTNQSVPIPLGDKLKENSETGGTTYPLFCSVLYIESLILAQDERWRRG